MIVAPTGGASCAPNIVARGRMRRLVFGWTTLVLGALAAVWLASSGFDRAWRLALLVPFWAGATGIFQAYAHT